MNLLQVDPLIAVVYPRGAGGRWLRRVLDCCLTNATWQNFSINYHRFKWQMVKAGHSSAPDYSCLSISNPVCKYNFWTLYFYKRVIFELNYTRERNQRLPLSPDSSGCISNRDHFYWLINQARSIQDYHWDGQFELDWASLFEDPKQAWCVISDFLDFYGLKNHWTFDNFIISVSAYKYTCTRIHPKVNFNQKQFIIWCLAYLQNQNIHAAFDVFENFNTKIMKDWIYDHKSICEDFTNYNLYHIKI